MPVSIYKKNDLQLAVGKGKIFGGKSKHSIHYYINAYIFLTPMYYLWHMVPICTLTGRPCDVIRIRLLWLCTVCAKLDVDDKHFLSVKNVAPLKLFLKASKWPLLSLKGKLRPE